MKLNQDAIARFRKHCAETHGLPDAAACHAGPFSDPQLAPYQEMLLDLVKERRKLATARLDMEFEKYGIPRRVPGDLWLVTDTAGEPAYLIRITDVTVWPFDRVPLSFAQREGEGDNSLDYWRRVHKEYFVQQLEQWGLDWSDGLDICCEGFEVVETA